MSDLLAKYYRSPGIHVTLPSGGHYCRPGMLETAINGELAVLPMTSADEIMTKNPDGLLNGHSIEQIISSCVPGIKDVRSLPTQDIDFLLLAIKLCTYGDAMELSATCPKCKTENKFSASIRERLSMVNPLEPEYMVRVGDEVVVYLRPYDYVATTKLNLAAFEETKLFQALLSAEITDEQRSRMFSQSYSKIARLNLDLLSRCILRVVVPGGTVEDPASIEGFVRNSDKRVVQLIQAKLDEIAKTGLVKTVDLVCENPECNHEWNTDLTFDPSHFFE